MNTPVRRIIRLPRLLTDKLGGISKSTFFRRYRYSSDFPEPINLPDAMLGWWEDEIDSWIESRGRGVPSENVAPLPAHWRGNPRDNANKNGIPSRRHPA